MQFPTILLALLASSTTILSHPVAQDSSVCVGSSFSPTNCDPNTVNVDPDVTVDPTIQLKEREDEKRNEEKRDGADDVCVGSSFSPTNCGANTVNVDPSVDVSSTVDTSGLTGS